MSKSRDCEADGAQVTLRNDILTRESSNAAGSIAEGVMSEQLPDTRTSSTPARLTKTCHARTGGSRWNTGRCVARARFLLLNGFVLEPDVLAVNLTLRGICNEIRIA